MIQISNDLVRSIFCFSKLIVIGLCIMTVEFLIVGGGNMNLEGFFQTDKQKYSLEEPIWVTLVVQNNDDSEAYLFVARGRADGIRVTLKEEQGFRIKGMNEEPDVGLIPEKKLLAGEAYTQKYLLTQWLIFNEPGSYTVECAIEIEAYNVSLHQKNLERVAKSISIANNIHLVIEP